MKWCVLLLALLQSLGCSGFPLPNSELASMSNRGLVVALAEVNSIYAVSRLYQVTRGSVTRVIPLGQDTYDLLMTFGIKETVCLKSSGEDPQKCAIRPGFFVSSPACSSRVRVSAQSALVVSLKCGHDSSSSEESSEEIMSRGRQQFIIPLTVNRDPAPSRPDTVVDLASPPSEPSRSSQRQSVGIRFRGDSFNNYLE
ncbi:secreted phosphoprotein 24 [Lampris incognitus]|uniref:secreted phosphoprotein 24 n=1 Tax=Lampris incognitus TaxID=2546036 RepID=UPI0024B513B8|nr:secreted phosphoprotein 24 [Lampris incognitus]